MRERGGRTPPNQAGPSTTFDNTSSESQLGPPCNWRYALGLELTDAGFDFSALSEFRSRLIAGAAEERLLTQLLAHFAERGSYSADAPPHLRTVPAVEMLRQVWVQQYYQEDSVVHWRDAKNFPPSSLMIASPYDLDSRYSEQRGHSWRGYNVHLTDTCDDEAPHLITHVETTLATDQDVTAVDTIHHALADQALLPTVHVVDGAYVSSDGLVASQGEAGRVKAEREFGLDRLVAETLAAYQASGWKET